MPEDVEMKDSGDAKAPAEPKAEEEKPKKLDVQQVLTANMQLISKAVATRETRPLIGRVLRQTADVRPKWTKENLAVFISSAVHSTSPVQSVLLHFIADGDQRMELDDPNSIEAPKEPFASISQPEEELYCFFVLSQYYADQKDYDTLLKLTNLALKYLQQFNRRTLDMLSARIYFYASLAHEKLGRLADLRSTLLESHCTASLNHDEYGQEALLNLLLRNYLHYNLYDQAEKLRAQAQRPETTRSNQQYCRYLYYLGRIRAVQLEYSEAKDCLMQAVRKAPTVAKGFIVTVSKWLIVIRLLLGEVPVRADFYVAGQPASLQAYLELTHAVRGGDVTMFNTIADRFGEQFRKEGTNNLIQRLRYVVIRAGLRRISVAYSCISLQDVARKLGLPTDKESVKDTEWVVAKTIRDGSISAVLDHDKQQLMSKEVADIYITTEPQQAFHARTAFCMDIHNEAVRAMRYATPAEKPPVAETNVGLEEKIAAVMAEDDEGF